MGEKFDRILSSVFYRGKHEYYDYSLIFVVLILTTFGIIMVYSTTSYSDALTASGPMASAKKQAFYALIAIVSMLIVSKLEYHSILRLAPVIGIAVFGLCCLVFILGIASNGATRWIKIGPVVIQPSEFAKGALILVLARYLPLHVLPKKRTNGAREIGFALKTIGITLAFVAPVITENLSTGIIIFLIGVIMAYVPNRNGIFFWGCLAVGLFIIVFSWRSGLLQKVLADYQVSRITAWLDPENSASDSAYQILQGLYAIGSGGLFGKGLGNSIQKLGFLPEAQNDMIFAIVCEEFGMFGAFLIMGLYIFLIYRLYNLANRAVDMSGSLIIIGVMIHLGLQVVMNIAVVTNSMPNTGVALPFISSGGSALISMFLEIGLVLSVTNHITE